MKTRTFAPAVARPVAPVPKPAPVRLARTCDCGSHAGGGTCAACAEKKKQRKLSRFSERQQPTLTRARDPLTAASSAVTSSFAASGAGASPVPPIVHDVLRGSGHPLPADLRAFMEPRFGTDFGDVRLHTDGHAALSSHAVAARAYTVGPHVVFGANQFQPATVAGRRLIAHELTHVVQQRGSHGAAESISDPSDASEHEAEATAGRILASEPPAAARRFAHASRDAISGAASPSAAVPAAPARSDPAHAAPALADPAPAIVQRSANPELQRELSDEAKIGLGIAGGALALGGIATLIAWGAGAFDPETFTPEQLTEYLEGLAKRRTPELRRDSDNKARDVVRHWEKGDDPKFDVDKGHKTDGGELSGNSLKRLLIREMLDGVTADGDEKAIITILRKSKPEDVLDILDPANHVTMQELDDKIGGENHAALEQVLAEKFPKGSPATAQEHKDASCTARQRVMLHHAQQQAVRWVDNAVQVLPRLNDSAVKQALDCWFPEFKAKDRFAIFQTMQATQAKLATRQYFCGLESGVNALEPTVLIARDGRKMTADCIAEDADSFVKDGKTTHPEVFLCGNFFKRDPYQQALTIVHESVHAAGLLEDPAYQPGCGLKLETALRNPDSYAYLAASLMALTGTVTDPEAKKSLPSVTVGNFRNTGDISEENHAEVGQELPGLGPDPNTGLNIMELRGDISGKADNVQFEFRRTKEMAIWWKSATVGWTRDVHQGPGEDDDRLNRDESLTPVNGHIYSIDGPGLGPLSRPLPPRLSQATEAVYMASFLESVEARVPPAGWTRVSNVFPWVSQTWIERAGGSWQRKPGKNFINPGQMTIGDVPPEPAAAPQAAPQNAPQGAPQDAAPDASQTPQAPEAPQSPPTPGDTP